LVVGLGEPVGKCTSRLGAAIGRWRIPSIHCVGLDLFHSHLQENLPQISQSNPRGTNYIHARTSNIGFWSKQVSPAAADTVFGLVVLPLPVASPVCSSSYCISMVRKFTQLGLVSFTLSAMPDTFWVPESRHRCSCHAHTSSAASNPNPNPKKEPVEPNLWLAALWVLGVSLLRSGLWTKRPWRRSGVPGAISYRPCLLLSRP
jgi:hypothetical protein